MCSEMAKFTRCSCMDWWPPAYTHLYAADAAVSEIQPDCPFNCTTSLPVSLQSLYYSVACDSVLTTNTVLPRAQIPIIRLSDCEQVASRQSSESGVDSGDSSQAATFHVSGTHQRRRWTLLEPATGGVVQ